MTTPKEATKLAQLLRRHAERPTGSCTFRRWVRTLSDLSSLQESEESHMVRPFHAYKCCAKGDRQPARTGFEPPWVSSCRSSDILSVDPDWLEMTVDVVKSIGRSFLLPTSCLLSWYRRLPVASKLCPMSFMTLANILACFDLLSTDQSYSTCDSSPLEKVHRRISVSSADQGKSRWNSNSSSTWDQERSYWGKSWTCGFGCRQVVRGKITSSTIDSQMNH